MFKYFVTALKTTFFMPSQELGGAKFSTESIRWKGSKPNKGSLEREPPECYL